MMIEDYRRIFDFFFSGVEVPEKLRKQFFSWLEIHGNEPETKFCLRSIGMKFRQPLRNLISQKVWKN